MTENEIGTVVVKSAIKVHRALGPGLLENVYRIALVHELRKSEMEVQQEVKVPAVYDGITFDVAYRADIIVNNKVVLELKAVEQITKAHAKQLQTYLRLTNCKLGYILNFNSALMKDGIKRAVNNLEE